MALKDYLCCGIFSKKEGLTGVEIDALTDPAKRTLPFMRELCAKLKQNSVKTKEFFAQRHDRNFFRESVDLSGIMYADVLASPENKKYALKLAKAYQQGDEDAREIFEELGSNIKKIQHAGFQEMITAKNISTEVNERSSLLDKSA